MTRYFTICLVFMMLLSAVVFAQKSLAIPQEGKIGQWVTNGKSNMIVLEIEEIGDFEHLPIDERFESLPRALEAVKEAFHQRALKAVLIDVKIKNITRKPLDLGHRPKQAGNGCFVLTSQSGMSQDSANKNDFYNEVVHMSAVSSGRRLMHLGEVFLSETSMVPAGQSVRGKLFFLVPENFVPQRLTLHNADTPEVMLVDLEL